MRIDLTSIFVVSLTRAHDRRANVAYQFSRLTTPAKFQIWDAVDGYALVQDATALQGVFDERLLDRSARHFSTHPKRAGIIGFTLSYVRIFQHIVTRGLEWTLVLEDDFEFVRPDHDFSTLDVAEGADIVSLDTRMNRRGIGTMGTVFSRAAASSILATAPLQESFDIWMSKNSHGFIGGKAELKSSARFLFLDTVSYNGSKKLIRASTYKHDQESSAVSDFSYLGGDR